MPKKNHFNSSCPALHEFISFTETAKMYKPFPTYSEYSPFYPILIQPEILIDTLFYQEQSVARIFIFYIDTLTS